MRTRAWSLALVGALAACASVGGGTAAPAAPVWTPVGTWSFITSAQGTTVAGEVTITEDQGEYGGTIAPDADLGMGTFPISAVERNGQEMRLFASAMGNMMEMILVFDGDTYDGSWTMGGMAGDVSGRRLR
ncbi:MAG: hypothetical protein R3E10_17785 [Gemmatimonadota bacterium]